MLEHTIRAMNTDCLLMVHVKGEKSAGEAALARAAARVAEYEQRFSRFLPESDLTHLNEDPGGSVRVSAELVALLARAFEYSRVTDGVFEPLVLEALEALGYDRSFEKVPARVDAQSALTSRTAHWASVRVDPVLGVVSRPLGARIDLGGVAKGAAADAAMAELASFPGALVDLGGDVRTHGRPDDAGGWVLAVDDPFGAQGDSLDYVRLRDGAIATSSVLKRQWRRNGGTAHHIIDPRTGRPAFSGAVQCTAIADTAEHADVAAKVGLILGAGSLSEDGAVGRALGLRGMAWVAADGGYHTTPGWRSHAVGS